MELNQMGLSVDDLRPPEDGAYDKRAYARVESAQLMSRRFMQRDAVKKTLIQQQLNYRQRMADMKQRKTKEWRVKTARSPFGINLVAENERIDENNRVRLREEARRARLVEKRKEEAKNKIILQALTETTDLDALRREKRAIIEEEKRLRALLDLEKSNAHRKAQLMAAARAEKQRKETKAAYRYFLGTEHGSSPAYPVPFGCCFTGGNSSQTRWKAAMRGSERFSGPSSCCEDQVCGNYSMKRHVCTEKICISLHGAVTAEEA
ncbi:unnamed protein product [Chrysoparadoxa australica]